MPNENHFANFAQNSLPWQRPLRNEKKRSRSIIYEQIGLPIILVKKIAKIGQVDPEILKLRAIIKKEKKERN